MKNALRNHPEPIEDVSTLKQKIRELEQSVAESRRTEEALRESEAKCRLAFESTSDGIFTIDSNFNISSITPSVERQLGYKVQEIINRPIQDLNILTSESLTRAVSDVIQVLSGVEVKGAVYEFIAKDGTRKIGEVTGTPIIREGRILGVTAVVRDITERKQAEEALKEQEEKYRNLFNNAEVGIFRSRLDGSEVMEVNRRFLEIVGMTMEETLGQPSANLWANPKEREEMVKRLVADGSVSAFEYKMLNKRQGDVRNCLTSLRLYRERGILEGSILDITERKKAEEDLKETLERLRKAISITIQVMVSAVESRDPYTAGHQTRSADLARAIATEMGLSQDTIEGIRMAGSIHDIGKLSIPAEILSKPTKLSDIEFSLIKEHARKGYELLKDVESPWPLAEIVHQHHERMDGSGYPRNLKGEEICLEARILSVADVVEAMASHRPYRPGLGIDAALNEIKKNRGIFYDDAVADACLRLFREKGFKLEGT
jgi:PAS domain S-box-containing protein